MKNYQIIDQLKTAIEIQWLFLVLQPNNLRTNRI